MLKSFGTSTVFALAFGLIAPSVEAGDASPFGGNLALQTLEQQALERRKAEARRKPAIAPRRAAPAQQARAAEYRRMQLEKEPARSVAASPPISTTKQDNITEIAKTAAPLQPSTPSDSAAKTTSSLATSESTDSVAKIATPLSATSPSTDSDDRPRCRKYSAATNGMVDGPCP